MTMTLLMKMTLAMMTCLSLLSESIISNLLRSTHATVPTHIPDHTHIGHKVYDKNARIFGSHATKRQIQNKKENLPACAGGPHISLLFKLNKEKPRQLMMR